MARAGEVVKPTVTSRRETTTSSSPSVRTARARPSTRRIVPAEVSLVQGEAVASIVPGATTPRRRTVPLTPSIRRASSHQGRRPARPVLSESVTRTLPDAVVKVVSSTFVPGT
ncbi:hypothetical protein [Litorihabitans aurantiacus]|uniref:Uncharacterized protein n=1 Tax=Litorihabitans aurantiacus TaxID=1930061 RepID=A0AA38CSB8_9MICO|nr:hypothetical protein GCM10025875_15010 [Litorihabitans aurantiacus]